MHMIKIENGALPKGMASPEICNALCTAGIVSCGRQWYIITSDGIYYTNDRWDPCGLYEMTDKGYVVSNAQEFIGRVPAYTMSELADMLPDFMLIKQQNGNTTSYEASLDRLFDQVPVVSATRIEDAPALLLLEMLKAKATTPAICNQKTIQS